MNTPAYAQRLQILVFSDVHYACEAERARGHTESKVISNPLLKLPVWFFRRFFWQGAPMAQNHFLDHVLASTSGNHNFDLVVVNGDFTSDTRFIGVADDAAFESAKICIEKIKSVFGDTFQPVYGDHEIGKMSLFGGQGGPLIRSWRRTKDELGIEPCWRRQLGNYVVMGVTSTVLAQPVYEAEMLSEELDEWNSIREQHISEINVILEDLQPEQRLIIFCHDPTALNALIHDTHLQQKLNQVETTFIGHLHSPLILSAARMLAGMPTIRFLGNSIRRMSQALNAAREWECLNLRICPSINGIRLLRDGGYYTLSLDPAAKSPVKYEFHPTRHVPWTGHEVESDPGY